MRRNFTRMVVLVCAVLCASAGVQAQSVGHRKAAESLNAMLTKVPSIVLCIVTLQKKWISYYSTV